MRWDHTAGAASPSETSLYSMESLSAAQLASITSPATPTVVHSRTPSVEVMRKRTRAAVACFKKYANLVCKHYPSILNEKTPCDAEGLC